MSCIRWPCYVAFSALLNAAIASAVKVPAALSAPQAAAPVRLNLISAAAPAPPPAQVRRAPAPAATPVMNRMVTHKQAPRNIKMAEEQKPPQTETTAAAKDKPQRDATPDTAQDAASDTDAAPDTARLPSDDGRAATTVIREASYRYQRPPAYPRRALELGQQGTVTLHAQVAPDGLPRELKVVQSSGYTLLDHAALTAIKKWEFEPVQVDGRAVAGRVRIPVRFVIED